MFCLCNNRQDGRPLALNTALRRSFVTFYFFEHQNSYYDFFKRYFYLINKYLVNTCLLRNVEGSYVIIKAA